VSAAESHHIATANGVKSEWVRGETRVKAAAAADGLVRLRLPWRAVPVRLAALTHLHLQLHVDPSRHIQRVCVMRQSASHPLRALAGRGRGGGSGQRRDGRCGCSGCGCGWPRLIVTVTVSVSMGVHCRLWYVCDVVAVCVCESVVRLVECRSLRLSVCLSACAAARRSGLSAAIRCQERPDGITVRQRCHARPAHNSTHVTTIKQLTTETTAQHNQQQQRTTDNPERSPAG